MVKKRSLQPCFGLLSGRLSSPVRVGLFPADGNFDTSAYMKFHIFELRRENDIKIRLIIAVMLTT